MQESDPKIVDVEHPEPRIIGVDEAADEDEDRQAGIRPAKLEQAAELVTESNAEEPDDDPAEPDAPGDPETDNEAEGEPEGDGDNAPGEDKPADLEL